MINKSINLLGKSAKDRVTGLKGVITSVCFDLYGCIQVVVTSKVKDDGELPSNTWYDINRVAVDDSTDAVMPVPDFNSHSGNTSEYTHGAAKKPMPAG